jgi:hypothetical protein
MSNDHSCKSGVKELIGDAISGLPHPLLTETTSGRNLESHKTLKNLQTVADTRVQYEDTKDPPSVSLSNSEATSSGWSQLLPISAFSLFSRLQKALMTRKR